MLRIQTKIEQAFADENSISIETAKLKATRITMIDEAARERANGRYGLADCLHVPIGAVDEMAISSYIGNIEAVLSGHGRRCAFLVRAREPAPRDLCFPIWDIAGSDILHQPLQVWVDISYKSYRAAYRRAFPTENITGRVLSHAINRRMARYQGFQFVRLTPVSRAANSSSILAENWGVSLHTKPNPQPANLQRGAYIQYADISSLILLLDMKIGGGVMDAVNEGQKLIRPRKI